MFRFSSGRICLFLLSLLVTQTHEAWAAGAATVIFASGSPRVINAAGESRALLRGGEVQPGDLIDTEEGQVQLRFADGASMSLQPKTRFRIDAFRFVDRGNRASPGDGVAMSLIKGTLRTVSGLLGKEDHSQYKVGTTVATIGIRGTAYGATLDADSLMVTTYSGRVEVCSDPGCQQIGPGETVWVYERTQRPQLQPRAESLLPAQSQPELPQSPLVNTPVMTPAVVPPVSNIPANTAPPSTSPYTY